ncbi:hypothetical protein [Pseudonocardia sp. HH130630-07]|uniref:hypothetical protein n=1 Tax=Pseudonocardia sp. HH130630-07 TaxID=1690815 RepID=UPI000815285F|nr:hypothetical protein [Pseudonocardia sp. HH130630-07]ANY10634.1 hypothetical protein AFB00_29960 [Pseudonocardia sp. HH130630-07]
MQKTAIETTDLTPEQFTALTRAVDRRDFAVRADAAVLAELHDMGMVTSPSDGPGAYAFITCAGAAAARHAPSP